MADPAPDSTQQTDIVAMPYVSVYRVESGSGSAMVLAKLQERGIEV